MDTQDALIRKSFFSRSNVAMLVLLGASLSALCVASNEPHLEDEVEEQRALLLSPTQMDLGDVPAGSSRTASFQIKNQSAKRIFVTEVSASCSCTAANFTPKWFAPGDIDKVQLIFSPDDGFGRVAVAAVVRFHEAGQPDRMQDLPIMISAMVRNKVEISPAHLDFHREQDSTQAFRIASGIGKLPEIKSVTCSDEAIDCRIESVEPDLLTVRVDFSAGKWSQMRKNSVIRILTDDVNAPFEIVTVNVSD